MSMLSKLRHNTESKIRHVPHEQGTPVLRGIRLNFRFDNELVLDEINFELDVGERLAVVGPNGAGKSTLFKIIAGILRPNSGMVEVYGHEPHGHICIAYVPQRSQIDWNLPVSVADMVMMGRVGKLGLFRWPGRKDWEIVHQALDGVGMHNLSNRQIGHLSGGQQQRMFIARALAQEAELMLMDEPFGGLDVNSREDLFSILDVLRKRNVTVMVALHDLKVAADQFDRIMLLNKKLYGLGNSSEVFEAELVLVLHL